MNYKERNNMKRIKMIEKINFEKLQRLSQGNTDISVTLDQKAVKLFEETGEFADAIDAAMSNPTLHTPNPLHLDVLEEGCDSMNVLLDILIFLKIPIEDIKKIINTDTVIARNNTTTRMCIKLHARGGDFAQAILKMSGAKNVSASAGTSNEGILLLSNKIIGYILLIIEQLDLPEGAFADMFNKKLDKWERKVGMAKRGEI